MAKTVDELVLKTSVEGAASLDQVNAKLASIDESAKKTATAMNQVQGGVRNVAYQIQDVAVQLSMGTNAFIVMTQQLPQLLSGFGTLGVVIGAVAAVAIPLLQKGLEAAGMDFRSLNARVSDLTQSTSDYIAAQKENQATSQGLSTAFGNLSDTAKQFYQAQEDIRKQKAFNELTSAVSEYQLTLRNLNPDIKAMRDGLGGFSAPAEGVAKLQSAFQRWQLGLTADQAENLSKRIRELDASSPEKFTKQVVDIKTYLAESGIEAGKNRQLFDDMINPLLKINEQLLDQTKNIRAAADAAATLQTDLTDLQNKFSPDINKAKRNFDQVTAIQLEGREKVAEFTRQMDEKEKEGTVSKGVLEKERASGLLRIQQDTSDKVKDFAKGQSEAYRSIMLTNDGKVRQLELESKILNIQDKGRLALTYQVQYDEAIATNAKNYADTIAAIGEQRRKNQITASDEKKAIEDAAKIQKQSDEVAAQARQKRIADLQLQNDIQQQGILFGLMQQNVTLKNNLVLEQQSLRFSTIGLDTIRQINDATAKRDAMIQSINANVGLGEEEQQKRIAIVNDQYREQVKLLKEQNDFREAQQKSFGQGAGQRIKEITESMSNFKVAGMAVDAVWSNMSSAIDNFVTTGKFKFKDFALSVIMDLEKIALKSAVIGVFKSMGFGDIFSLPGKALGGPVSGGTPYMIGEAGPEMFIPSTAGTIIPNSQLGNMGGGGTTVINNISAVDARSVAQLFAEHRMTLFGTVEQARRELPMRTR